MMGVTAFSRFRAGARFPISRSSDIMRPAPIFEVWRSLNGTDPWYHPPLLVTVESTLGYPSTAHMMSSPPVPQDGEWFCRGSKENMFASDILEACRRLDVVVTWDCGGCNQRGPLLIQRGLRNDFAPGEGLQPRPEQVGLCTVVRPDPHRGWLELWQAGGRTIPVIPIPAECAEYFRDKAVTGAGARNPMSEAVHHLGALTEIGMNGGM